MRTKSQGGTRVDAVYAAIKDDIWMGRLLPGERIKLDEVTKANDVSLTVVREAVTRLAAEHLVDQTPQHGFHVRELSVAGLQDLTRVRIAVETMAVRESVTLGDIEWEADLVAAHHRLSASVRKPGEDTSQPNFNWMRAHSDFHAALVARCQSPILLKIRQQLFEASELYRYWSTTIPAKGRARPVAKEHQGILQAALSRDADLTAELVAGHLQRTSDILAASRTDTAENKR